MLESLSILRQSFVSRTCKKSFIQYQSAIAEQHLDERSAITQQHLDELDEPFAIAEQHLAEHIRV
jgi:hypothetical protein